MTQACLNEETIDAFVAGRATAELRPQVEAHLDRCATCSAIVVRLLNGSEDCVETTVGLGRSRNKRRPFNLREGDSFGKYILLKELGAGGMGRVFAAYDTALERKVALKFLAAASDEAAVARLLIEASAMAKISHPNVVTIFDAGVIDGEPFIAMELVDGQTLAMWSSERRRPARDVAVMMAGAAHGIAAAHAAGIIHRDIKPQNILVRNDRAVVTDFGVSLLGTEGIRGIVGTPGYMAPEQFTGAPVNERTDVFAFCATLYTLLTGGSPFGGSSLREVEALVNRGVGPAALDGVNAPAHLRDLILRGLSPDPSRRPTTMVEVAEILLSDPAAKRRTIARIVAACAAVTVAFGIGNFLTGSPERRCRAGTSAIDPVLANVVVESLGRRYEMLGHETAWQALRARLRTFVTQWKGSYTEVCASSFGKNRQSERLLDLRMACLDARRVGFEAIVTGLSHAGDAQLTEALGARLPDLDECGHFGHAGQKPLPSDPGRRRRGSSVERLIAEAETQLILGNDHVAAEVSERALADARSIGYEPLVARALNLVARVEGRRGESEAKKDGVVVRIDRAKSLLHEAMTLAERGGDDFNRAVSARMLIREYEDDDQIAEARYWAALSDALVSRIGDPAAERAKLNFYLADLEFRFGDRDRGREMLGRAVEMTRVVHGETSPELVSPRTMYCAGIDDNAAKIECYQETLAFAQSVLGRFSQEIAIIYQQMSLPLNANPATRAQGCEALEKAKQIAEARVAANNDLMIYVLNSLASCRQRQGEVVAARRAFDQLLRSTTTLSNMRASARLNYAVFLVSQADDVDAERYFRLAAADAAEVGGKTNVRFYLAKLNIAQLLLKRRRPDAALREAREVLGAFASAGVRLPSDLGFLTLGDVFRTKRRWDEASRAFSDALKLHDELKSAEPARAAAYFGLGKVAYERGRVREAVPHLERAVALFEKGSAELVKRATASHALAIALADPRDRTAARSRERSDRACSLARDAARTINAAPGSNIAQRRSIGKLLKTLQARGVCRG